MVLSYTLNKDNAAIDKRSSPPTVLGIGVKELVDEQACWPSDVCSTAAHLIEGHRVCGSENAGVRS